MRVRMQNEGAGDGQGYVGTSTTEHVVDVNWTATFTTQPGLLFAIGERVRAQATDPGGNALVYMDGTATGYSDTLLTILVDTASGPSDVTFTSWQLLNLSAVVAGDMRFGHQQADFLRDSSDAVAQVVLTRLRLWTGEWFLDSSEGTPYAGAVLGVGTRKQIEPALRARIRETPGVQGIDSLSLVIDPDGRRAALAATITTQFGQAQLQGIL